jgi:hypothetical protein
MLMHSWLGDDAQDVEWRCLERYGLVMEVRGRISSSGSHSDPRCSNLEGLHESESAVKPVHLGRSKSVPVILRGSRTNACICSSLLSARRMATFAAKTFDAAAYLACRPCAPPSGRPSGM